MCIYEEISNYLMANLSIPYISIVCSKLEIGTIITPIYMNYCDHLRDRLSSN